MARPSSLRRSSIRDYKRISLSAEIRAPLHHLSLNTVKYRVIKNDVKSRFLIGSSRYDTVGELNGLFDVLHEYIILKCL